MRRGLVLAGLLAAIALPCRAQTVPDDYVGVHGLSADDGSFEECRVDLLGEAVGGGWKLELAADCEELLDLPPGLVAWRVDGQAVQFLDREGRAALRFGPEDGYTGERQDGPGLVLLRTTEDRWALTDEQRMTGGLTLTGADGDLLCRYDSLAGARAKTGRLTALAPCSGRWAGVTHWRTNGRELVLLDLAEGEVLTLVGEPYIGFSNGVRLQRDEDFRPPPDGDVGSWTLELERDGRTLASCPIELLSRWAEQGWRARQPPGCVIPGLATVAAWKLDESGDLQLFDAAGEPILLMRQREDFNFETDGPDGALLVLRDPRPL